MLCLERFAAATSVLDIRVLESESRTYSIFCPVHLAANDGEESL